jgi:cobalt/nickel transport system permease protein
MHMADALISPVVGVSFWAAGAAVAGYSAKQAGKDLSDQKIPLMGVLGAFVFAAQMINFAIPGTGSSGHLGGGLLLAVLLGRNAGFLVMVSILLIQSLLFADGGLLALGCNVINLAFFPCYVAYPLLYKPIAGPAPSKVRVAVAVTLATVVGLQLGALAVVAETVLSGITELPFATFAWFMLPIHLVIGLVEAAVTSAVLWYVWQEAPELLSGVSRQKLPAQWSSRRLATSLLLIALFVGGVLPWFASERPDGLEWSILQTAGKMELEAGGPFHETAAAWQQKLSLFADYQFKLAQSAEKALIVKTEAPFWSGVDSATSGAGLVGSVLTLVIAGGVGAACYVLARRG